MRVLHVININAYGGAEKLIPVFLPSLQNAGLDIGCLIFHGARSGEAAQAIASQLKEHGITVFTHAHTSIWNKAIRNKIASVILDQKYELVHSHLKYADLWMAWLKRSGQVSVPVISTLHGYRDSYQNKHGLHFSKSILLSPYYWLTKFIYRKLDGFILISRCLKAFYEKTGVLKNKQHEVIYHGFASEKNIEPILNTTSSVITSPAIALPGRLIRMKGHRFAVAAMVQLTREYPGAVLHVFGAGPEESAIRMQVEQEKLTEQVLFYGYVNDMQARLKKMDIILIPSMGESFGMVFLEAFAAGVPVVAFDLPAGNEIVRDGGNGLLAKPENVNSLVEKIKLLCNDAALRKRIVNQATTDLLQQFSLTRMANQYQAFYQSILSAHE